MSDDILDKNAMVEYADLEKLRLFAKQNNVENPNKKSEKIIVGELSKLGFDMVKMKEDNREPEDMLSESKKMKEKAEKLRKEANLVFEKKSKNQPTPPSLTDLRSYSKKVEKKSEILKRVKMREAEIHKSN